MSIDNEKQSYFELLENLSDKPLPSNIQSFDVDQLKHVQQLVENVLEKDRAGLDGLFDSMSQTFKYIPNFLLLAITNKYIEPPIAARITVRLSIKQSVTIANGLPDEYVSKTAVYLEDAYASALLCALAKNKAQNIIGLLFESHPLKAIDILGHASEKFIKKLTGFSDVLEWEGGVLSESRLRTIEKLKSV